MTDLEYLFDGANKAGVALSIEHNAQFDYATMTAEKNGKKYVVYFNLNMQRNMKYTSFEFHLEKAISQFDNLENKKKCKNCIYADKISENEYYCAGGKERLGDVVSGDSTCPEWADER